MGHRQTSIRWVWIAVLVLCCSFAAIAVEPEVTYEWQPERDGHRELMVATPLANYVFSENGGVMTSALLTFAPYGSNVAELVAGTTTDASTLARRYTVDAEFPFALHGAGTDGTYTLEEPTWTEEGALVVTLRGELDDYVVKKRFEIHPEALFTMPVEIGITPRGTSTTSANTVGDGDTTLSMTFSNYIPNANDRELTYLFDDERGTAQLAEGSYFVFGGLGLMDKQVVFFLHPTEGGGVLPFAEATASGSRRFGVQLEPTAQTTYRFSVYAGRRRNLLMNEAGIGALDKPGIGARAMVAVIKFLDILYRYTGNYAWAIILFTLMTRIILFPLMRKQYHSMAKMQRIQPRLKRIQARYKDNKQEMQQKVLEIYKKEGVNPMGGCLPMIIQLPIIFVIWRAMLYASEAIHLSPGFLWIPDLSQYDPYFVLVIITTLVMMVQQRFMTPMTQSDGPGFQKYIGYIFPLFMAFFLWRFPAGLWLYYLLTTVAQVGQQYFVNWEMARAGGGTMPLPDEDDEPFEDDEESADDGDVDATDGD